jgi:hypothetical protein
MDHTSRAMLAQCQVGGAPEEVPAFQPLLAGLDLAGTVITADALQTHPQAAEFLVADKQAHYLFQVKANQPTLLARCTGRSTSPPRYAAMLAIHADPSPPSGSTSDEPDITTERRSPARCRGPPEHARRGHILRRSCGDRWPWRGRTRG